MSTRGRAAGEPSGDVVVVGGGLGGLATATLVARQGRSVTLYEKAAELGGRGASHLKSGVTFNIGPHALYRKGAARDVLGALGVEVHGGTPPVTRAFAVAGDAKHTLPGGPLSLLTTSLFPLPAKLEVARLLASLPRVDTTPLAGQSVNGWLAEHIRHAAVREFVRALVRLTSYTNAPDEQSAGAALTQLRLGLLGNVLYLDGGWQTIVDGLQRAAERAGVRVVRSMRVAAVEHDGRVHGVRLANGTVHAASVVVLAGGPAEAHGLVPGVDALARAEADAVPVQAACLDVALTRLPDPRALFALGVDRPLYFSVHTRVAKLAPDGMAVVHVAKYLPVHAPSDAHADERELEALLDLVQPGWRSVVHTRRTLPRMTVSHAVVTAAGAGYDGRPGPAVPGIRGLYVVGDWVGHEGMLADATLASARAAAMQVAQLPGTRASGRVMSARPDGAAVSA